MCALTRSLCLLHAKLLGEGETGARDMGEGRGLGSRGRGRPGRWGVGEKFRGLEALSSNHGQRLLS